MQLSGISNRTTSFIILSFWLSTVDPQINHMLSGAIPPKIVDKLCIRILLLARNDKHMRILGMLASGFLPTMKIQPSQLP